MHGQLLITCEQATGCLNSSLRLHGEHNGELGEMIYINPNINVFKVGRGPHVNQVELTSFHEALGKNWQDSPRLLDRRGD